MCAMLLVYMTDSGFITDYAEERRYYVGSFPKIDIWERDTLLWLWLLEHGIFNDCREVECLLEDKSLTLMRSFKKTFEIVDAKPFKSETDFILSLIDKLQLEMLVENGTDYMRLDYLEKACHEMGINLFDFFLSLELDRMIVGGTAFCYGTSARLYHIALSILLEAKNVSLAMFFVLCDLIRKREGRL